MKFIINIVFIIILTAFSLLDIKNYRISKNYTNAFMVLGIFAGVISLSPYEMIKGLGIALLISLFLLWFGVMGGADLKIYVAIGAAFGVKVFIRVLINSILIGGIMGIGILVYKLLVKHVKVEVLMKLEAAFVPAIFLGMLLSM